MKSSSPRGTRTSGALLAPLRPYDGRTYDNLIPDGGILSALADQQDHAARFRREQQFAKLRFAFEELGIDPENEDSFFDLLIRLCEDRWPGFRQQKKSGPNKQEITLARRNAAFELIHLYQVDCIRRRGQTPTFLQSAKWVAERLSRNSFQMPGPLLAGAIVRARHLSIKDGITALHREAYRSQLKVDRDNAWRKWAGSNSEKERKAIELWHLSNYCQMQRLDAALAAIKSVAIVEDQLNPLACAIRGRQFALGLGLYAGLYNRRELGEGQQRAICELAIRAKNQYFLLSRRIGPGKSLIGKPLQATFAKMGLKMPIYYDRSTLIGIAPVALVALGEYSPPEILMT